MQQTWEWQQPSAYATTMQPASLLPSHAWDVWQSDPGQGMNGQESSYNNCIYPPGTYTANQNQAAGGSYYSTPGIIPQETWHTDPAAYNNPDSQAPPPAAGAGAVVSSEGCTQTTPPYGISCFGSYPTAAYQQDSPWSYASADSGVTPEPNVYYAGAPYPNGDHPLYLDHAAEQQRQIEHAQYLISRWGASDDSTPAPDSASPVMNSSGAQAAASTAIFPAPAPYNHVQDQHWTPEGATSSSSSSWGTFVTRPQCTSWPYNPSQARAAVREHGSQTQPPPPPAAPPAAAAAAMSSERRQQSWTPKEFQPDDQDEQRSTELSPSSATAAAK